MSPELFDPDRFGLKESCPTKESDCYALGMVIYEVLSGQVPFALCKEVVVIFKILDGERPVRPQGEEGSLFTDSIWNVLQLCWKPQPHDRASAEAVLLGLEGNSLQSRTSKADEGVETRAGIGHHGERIQYVFSVSPYSSLITLVLCNRTTDCAR